jgi:phosphoglycerate dehydrogenase-like enzyme
MNVANGNNKPLILFDPYPRSKESHFSTAAVGPVSDTGPYYSCRRRPLDPDTIDTYLPDAAALVGQTDMPAERLNRAKNLKAILNVEGNFLPNVDYEMFSKRHPCVGRRPGLCPGGG